MIRLELQLPAGADHPLARLRARLPRRLRACLAAALEHGLARARERLSPGGGGPTSHSGRLAASLTSRLAGRGLELQGTLAARAPYAAAQEYGAVIQARRAAYLKFQVQGRWVQVKRVTLPARPFLGPSADDAAGELERLIIQALLEESP